jgi:PhoD related phosphatase
MPLLMGPVLSFRGCDDGNWNLTAVVVAKTNPGPLTAGGQAVQPESLWEQKSGTAWRYRFGFPMSAVEGTATYTVDGDDYQVRIPANGQAPRMAYASCNGFSSLKLMKQVDDNNYLWTTMARKHGLKPAQDAPAQDDPNDPVVKDPLPYHLLLLGGDQVYADAMWETLDPMMKWAARDWDDGNSAKIPDATRRALDQFYFGLYTDRWSQPAVAQMMARVPSIAMWDDHDLTDGWGSYPVERQNSEMYGAIWNSAVKAFSVFQQHLREDERRPGTIGQAPADWWKQAATAQRPTEARVGAFSFAYRIGGVAVLAIDMRSQRTSETQVVGAKHWDEIYAWTDALDAGKVTHLIVMASIPVVYPGFDTLESLLGFIPGHQDLEDDLRDHWNSKPHKAERVRMVHKLLDLPQRKIRTTLISGDVHVAALGVVESKRTDDTKDGSEAVINQLISSGIVHPGPGAAVVFALQHLFDSEDEMDRDITGRMMQFPGSQAKFIGNRNFLSIEPDADAARPRLWCNWLAEHEKFPYTKVVHPIG